MHALAQVEREIRAADSTPRCRYLRDFADAYTSYERVLSSLEVQNLLAACGTVLIGDYHTLSPSQRYASKMIDMLAASGRQVVVAVEAVFTRHQAALDEWMAGIISETELREAIRFDLDWGYDWQPYRELLQVARRRAAALYGIDCMPRNDLRRISQRDRHAASKIAEIRAKHPEAVIVVLFGESHLAPNHLPAMLRLTLPRERVLTILQNVDTLYWQAAGERRDDINAVRLSNDAICVFTATPLEKYESYRLCIDRWRRERPGPPDLAPSVYNLIEALLRFLRIPTHSPTNGTQPKFLVDMLPEVWCRDSQAEVENLLARKRVGEIETRRIVAKIEERGVSYSPQVNAIFATSFQIEAGAEEAARFVHYACQGAIARARPSESLSDQDRFYAKVMREALAFFGSRILYPARAPVRESDLYALYAQSREQIEEQTFLSYRDYMEMIDFLVLHKDFESNQRQYRHVPELIRTGIHYIGAKFDFVSGTLGQMLGTQLYDAYVAGRVAKRFVRSLFLRKLDRPDAARSAYFAVVRKACKRQTRIQ